MSEYKTPNFSIDLSGQIALVTGASSGLGYRFSKVLASCGAKVAISARRKEKLESWAVKQSEELIDNVMETNLTGPYILSCEVARKLIEEKKPGRMVNIASVAAFNTTPQSAASLYSITKKAVVRMTEALAVEWSKSYINVNAIAPGAFSSEMLDGMIERVGDFSQAFPRKRICTPEQMDSTLLFLVSPSSECVTGTCIKIDDGQGPR